MKMHLLFKTLLPAAIVSFLAFGSANTAGQEAALAQPILNNGSFEYGMNPPTRDRTLYATAVTPNREINNWVVTPVAGQTNGSVDWVKKTYWQAANGNYSVDLNGFGSAGAIYQHVGGLVKGGVYVVVFSLSGNPDGPPTTKKVKVSIDGQAGTFTLPLAGVTRTNMRYQTKAFAFVWTGKSKRLIFESKVPGPSGYGPVLDYVRVIRVL